MRSIDWELTLSLAANKEHLAKNLLKNFVAHLPQVKISIQDHYNTNERSELLEAIHKLHGACCYCGVPRLKQLSHTLEKILESEPSGDISHLMTDIQYEIEKIINAYQRNHVELCP